jgi:hypothetical protein
MFLLVQVGESRSALGGEDRERFVPHPKARALVLHELGRRDRGARFAGMSQKKRQLDADAGLEPANQLFDLLEHAGSSAEGLATRSQVLGFGRPLAGFVELLLQLERRNLPAVHSLQHQGKQLRILGGGGSQSAPCQRGRKVAGMPLLLRQMGFQGLAKLRPRPIIRNQEPGQLRERHRRRFA